LFGGNVIVEKNYANTEGSENFVSGLEYEQKLRESSEKIGYPIKYVNKRTITSGNLIFEGKKTITNIFGCDFEKEVFLKDKVVLVDGSWDYAKAKNSIILSESVVKGLKLEIGDTVLCQINTYSGQANFGEFVLAGVSKDISLIGSIAAYAQIDYVNELIGLQTGDFNAYTLMMADSKTQDLAAFAFEKEIRTWHSQITSLEEALVENPTSPITALYKQPEEKGWDGTSFVCASLNHQIPQLQSIASVVNLVSVGLLVVLFLVIMIGISNTYKMVLYERIREIGTMRALGMKQKQTGKVFAVEAVLLSLFGALVGFILAVIFMSILQTVNVYSDALSLFLNNGHATFVLSFGNTILKLMIVVLLTLVAVSSSVKKASKMNPAEALRTVK
jgi:putative ABC transport system permease protein